MNKSNGLNVLKHFCCVKNICYKWVYIAEAIAALKSIGQNLYIYIYIYIYEYKFHKLLSNISTPTANSGFSYI